MLFTYRTRFAHITARGLGNVTNLAIAASNDFELGEALASAAASRPKPKPDVLRSKRQPRTCSGVHPHLAANDNNMLARRAA